MTDKPQFDPEFVEQLNEENARAPSSPVTYITVVDHDAALQVAQAEVAEAQESAKKRRARTYLNSELPVRPCTSACPNRASCIDFTKGRVKDGEPCRPELRQIKKWQVAFRNGNVDALKDDVGSVAGTIAVQIGRLLESVVADGVMIDQERATKDGDIYTERVTHPALTEVQKLVKSLGLDLNSFLMTPKANKDAPPQVNVNVGVTPEEVQNRFAARFGGGSAKE